MELGFHDAIQTMGYMRMSLGFHDDPNNGLRMRM
jgi:hypothetical protein